MDITHIKIPKELRDRLKIAAIRQQKTLYKLTCEIFNDYLKKFESRKPYNTNKDNG